MANVIKDRVKESTTTTGAGNITLSGAPLGFRAFSTVCSVGDTFRYAIQAIDANGAPSGAWEVGIGSYVSANTIARTTVIDSSNAGSLVDFSAGDKEVWIGMDATMAAWQRERITSARTYYVRTDGSDSNNGLSDTSGGAFLTIQKAVNVATSALDIAAGITVTIKVADGTYSGFVNLLPFIGAGAISIVGNTTTPANCVISVTNNNCFAASAPSAIYSVSGFKLQTTTGGSCFSVANNGSISAANIDFGACAAQHIAASSGGSVYLTSNYTISGGGSAHCWAISGAVITTNGKTVTITGTPSFFVAYVWMDRGMGMVDCYGMTFSGSATGKRYIVNNNSVCFVNGASTAYLPGDVAGTTATGGVYG